MLTNETQSLKAHSPIDLAKAGILIFFNDSHPLNASDSMSVMDDGITICAKDEQL